MEFWNRCVSAQSKSEVRNRITAGRTFSGKSYNHCKIGSRQTDETKKKIGAKKLSAAIRIKELAIWLMLDL